MAFDQSKYGFQGGAQFGSAFSSSVAPAPSTYDNLKQNHTVGDQTATVTYETGNSISYSTNTQDLGDGTKHTNVTVQLPPHYLEAMNKAMTRKLVRVGDKCDNCRTGTYEGRFTTLGIILGIICFPIGLVALFSSRDKVCDKCGIGYNHQGYKIERA